MPYEPISKINGLHTVDGKPVTKNDLTQNLSTTIRVVFVDFGGVLFRYVPTRASRAIEGSLGLTCNLTRWLFDHPASWEALLGRKSAAEVFEALSICHNLSQTRLREIWAVFEKANVLDLTMLEALQSYRKLVKVFILSNFWSNGSELIRRKIPKDSIDGIFVSAELGIKKPEPALWDYLAKVLNQPKAAMMLIDDEEQNVTGALEAGLLAYLWIR